MNNNRENIKMCGIDAYSGISESNLSTLASTLAMCAAAVVVKRYEKSTPNVAPNKEHER